MFRNVLGAKCACRLNKVYLTLSYHIHTNTFALVHLCYVYLLYTQQGPRESEVGDLHGVANKELGVRSHHKAVKSKVHATDFVKAS